MVSALIPVLLILIFGVPTSIAFAPALLLESPLAKAGALALLPFVFGLTYVLVAGGLSRFFRKAIIPGTFARDLKDPVYGPRRLYGLCWTSVYYFVPLYFAFLSLPRAKALLLRLFGYRGSTQITIFPDAWMRDLPLLDFADGAYIANRSTLGTNICLANGSVIVDGIRIGKGALVGHLALVGPGAILEDSTELGVHTAFGIRSRLQAGSKTGICVTLFHGVDIGRDVEIGPCSYIGLRAKIGNGVQVPAGANIPAGAIIESQEAMNQYQSSETSLLKEARLSGVKSFFGDLPGGHPVMRSGEKENENTGDVK